MPSVGAGEAIVVASTCVVAIALLLAPFALHMWGRRVAARHGNTRGWRVASALPLGAYLVLPLGAVVTAISLVHGFATVARVDAASRATVLARSISESMNFVALGLVASVALYVVSIALFAYGAVTRPAPR